MKNGYPFGMAMPARRYESGKYRYGFNGQEKSTEIDANGNSNTAEFWQYDARIGRRWNLDPRPSTSISPYNCFAGNPIWFSDPLGDTTINGQKMEGRNAASATTLQEVVLPSTARLSKMTPRVASESTIPNCQGCLDKRVLDIRPIELDYEKGQVMLPYKYPNIIVALTQGDPYLSSGPDGYQKGGEGGRNWYGYQVDENGYLTGTKYSENTLSLAIQMGGTGGKPGGARLKSAYSIVREIAKGGRSFIHHIASNKHLTQYTPQFEAIANKYELKLDADWNKVNISSAYHFSKHPNQYHEFVLRGMQAADAGAAGNQLKFLQLFHQYVKQPLLQKPNMLNKTGWE